MNQIDAVLEYAVSLPYPLARRLIHLVVMAQPHHGGVRLLATPIMRKWLRANKAALLQRSTADDGSAAIREELAAWRLANRIEDFDPVI